MGVKGMLMAAPTVLAFACKDIQVGSSKYDLSSFDETWFQSDTFKTPPSITNTTWYINPCGSVNVEQCPADSQICGIETIELDGQSYVAKIIPISNKAAGTKRESRALADGSEGLTLVYTGSFWGDQAVSAELSYRCSQDASDGDLSWDESKLTMFYRTPDVCANAKPPTDKPGDKPDDDKNKDSGSGWGFFTKTFFFILFVFVLYLGITSYINLQRHGQLGLDVSQHAEILRDLPYLARDFVRKISETFGGGGRRGYSAV